MNSKYFKEIDKKIYYPDKDSTNIDMQFSEIFVEQHYQEGKKRGGVMLDIGGNVGMASLYFAPNAKKMYVLEPVKEYFDCLKKNLKDFSNIKIFNLGLGHENGNDVMKTVNNGLPFSMFGEGDGQVVKTLRLDTFFEENKIDHVDVMKIDIEGMEYLVFGDGQMEKVASKIDFIIGEAHFSPGWPEVIPGMLDQYGYKTEFLPFENVKKTLKVADKYYTQNFKTMFIAYRI